MFGKIKLTNMKDLDAELELPMDEDENVGDGVPKKKRVKRKRTKEERAAERKVVFWVFFIIVGTTMGFWLWPRLKEFTSGFPKGSGWKNYVEYKL